jgi:lysyl-tRNA synthetase class 2
MAIAVAAVAAYAAMLALVHAQHDHVSVAIVTGSWSLSEAHTLMELLGLTLLALSTRLWRGVRAAVWSAAIGTGLVAVLALIDSDWALAALAAALIAALLLTRDVFTLARDDRPTLRALYAAMAAWALTYGTLVLAAAVSGTLVTAAARVRTDLLPGLVHGVTAHVAAGPHWPVVIDVLIVAAAVTSARAVRTLLRPAGGPNTHTEREHGEARAILSQHGTDSLSPFLLRPDKALLFASGGVLSYRVIDGTAVVSGDPVGPEGVAPSILAEMVELAAQRGWRLALWGASERHLSGYAKLGLRALHAGDEAVVDPARFTLDGRSVRKLRQSVHRVERRGWEISVCDGRELNARLECELDELELKWRATQRRILGFAMSMGVFDAQIGPDDLLVLGRSPDGELRAAMRFAWHRGKLSLDTMRRLPATPNGFNEALVVRALTVARERGVSEVSLNYAGLAHLVRRQTAHGGRRGQLERLLLHMAARRFQMQSLVCFNEKFSPEWRPRFLIYDSRLGLPLTALRVLQAEGYISEWQSRSSASRRRWVRLRPKSGAGQGTFGWSLR